MRKFFLDCSACERWITTVLDAKGVPLRGILEVDVSCDGPYGSPTSPSYSCPLRRPSRTGVLARVTFTALLFTHMIKGFKKLILGCMNLRCLVDVLLGFDFDTTT